MEGVCGDPEEEVEVDDWGLEGSNSGTERCCRWWFRMRVLGVVVVVVVVGVGDGRCSMFLECAPTKCERVRPNATDMRPW